MAMSYRELRALSDEEVISLYDSIAPTTTLGLGFLADEIFRRTAERQTAEMLRLTRQIRIMTCVVTVFTAINVLALLLN
jgi:type IV secretory pathway component VirB8